MDEKLRQDFPIDWDEDLYVSRREFFKFLTLASGGLAVGSVVIAAWSKNRKQIAFQEALVANMKDIPVGGSLQFTYPRPQDICILVRPDAETIVAYSQRCTHLSCPVEVQLDRNRFYCPCHNGAFAISDGHVLQGPPPRPLAKIILEVRGDEIFAKGVQT